MLYNGEKIGDGSPPNVDIAVDPLEGTTLCAKGMPSALAVIALAERGTMFDPGPCVYMEKLAGGPDIADLLTLDEPLGTVIERVAERKGTETSGVTVMMLDRPRHEEQMAEIREVGGRIRLISDGDVSAALFAVSESTGVDLLWGIGGTPEGVISAAAIKCLGGADARAASGPATTTERQAAIDARLRPRRDPRRRPAGLRRRRVLRRNGCDRRRASSGGSLPALGPGVDRVAGDAVALGHRPDRAGSPRPGEAARDHRRPLRLSWSPLRRPLFDSSPFGYLHARGTREPRIRAQPRRRRRHRLHRPQADARAARARRERPRAWRARPRRPRILRDAGAEVVEGRCPGGRRPARRSRGRLRRLLPRPFDGTRSHRTIRSPSGTSRARQNFGAAAKAAGVDLIVYLGGPLRRWLEAPREPPRERRDPRGVRGSRDLRPRGRGGRRRLGVVSHPVLPRQETAGDGHAAMGADQDPAHRDRGRGALSRRHSRASRPPTAARSRSAAPTSRPTAG